MTNLSVGECDAETFVDMAIYTNGLNQMYQWFEVAMLELQLDPTLRRIITDRVKKFREEK